jgi:hypothetical protein
MNEEKKSMIFKQLFLMVENGDGKTALNILRQALISVPKSKLVTDILVGVIDGNIPADKNVINKIVIDNVLDAFNEGKIDKDDAKRMCKIKT